VSGKRATIYGKLAIVMALVLVILAGALLATVREAKAIPAWARKYNADCAMCHYPVVPRLNSFGHQFRRAGYRTPDEFNKEQDVSKVGDFLAVRARVRFGYENKEGGIERSEFTLNDATFFYAGALTKNFSAFVESEIESTGDIELVGQLQGVFGRSDRYVSIRGGQMHPLQRMGFGGFDRPTGISTNPLHSTTLTRAGTISGANFALNKDQKGIEVAYVQGRARLLGQVLNGLNQDGSGTATKGDTDPQKDYLVAYEHILDDIASGFTLFYYRGTYHQTATPSAISQRFDFSRFGVNANKIFPVSFGFFELQGGFVRSYDNVPSSVGTDVEGNAFYVESQQVFKDTWLTFIERYALIDQDAARKNTKRQDYTLGAVMPVQTWLRAAAEYTYSDNRPETVPGTALTGTSSHSALLELMANW
jgi:hypothetical protein